MKRVFCILDCFVDEPACFGVPPFISPYPRYICGALAEAGVSEENMEYLTIDFLRREGFVLPRIYDGVFLIGGAVVPGKYLGAKIGTLAEIQKILEANPSQKFIAGGGIAPLLKGARAGNNAISVMFDIESFAFGWAAGSPMDKRRTAEEAGRWARRGAFIVRRHPDFPDIICEIETYRGCPRLMHCSFCSEGLFSYGKPDFRSVSDILSEIDELIAQGASRFRIGRQADILQYGTAWKDFKNGFPRPDASPLSELFGELAGKRSAGKIKVLNIDNANPGTIASFPRESETILKVLADAVTPGDTLALGVESFDPAVIKKNSLKATKEQAVYAVSMINEVCGYRSGGLPALLPGVNLIQGLSGETENTFALNYAALWEIADAGLLLKRINIRRLRIFPGTPIALKPERISAKMLNRFEYYKGKIRRDIDSLMLKRIYPTGTVLSDIKLFARRQGYSLGKQLASYSITLAFPELCGEKSIEQAVVTGHRERSLEALSLPTDINSLSPKGLEFIPGIGRKAAALIVLKRPFGSTEEFKSFMADKGLVTDQRVLAHCVAKNPAVIKHC